MIIIRDSIHDKHFKNFSRDLEKRKSKNDKKDNKDKKEKKNKGKKHGQHHYSNPKVGVRKKDDYVQYSESLKVKKRINHLTIEQQMGILPIFLRE